MGMFRKATAAFLLAIAAASPAAAADPFITVRPAVDGSTNSAFWILQMESRPTGATIAGLNLAQINEALDRTESPWCAADRLTPASFTSTSPAIRAEIAQYLGGSDTHFRATTRMTGRPLLAIVGNVRTCRGETAPFVLLIDHGRPAPRVAFVRIFTDWTPFIAMRADGNRLIFSSCLECDHAEILSWNRRTGRFFWRSEGP